MERSSPGARECHELRNYVAKQLKRESRLRAQVQKRQNFAFFKILFSIVFGAESPFRPQISSSNIVLPVDYVYGIYASRSRRLISPSSPSFVGYILRVHVILIYHRRQSLLFATSSVFMRSYPLSTSSLHNSVFFSWSHHRDRHLFSELVLHTDYVCGSRHVDLSLSASPVACIIGIHAVISSFSTFCCTTPTSHSLVIAIIFCSRNSLSILITSTGLHLVFMIILLLPSPSFVAYVLDIHVMVSVLSTLSPCSILVFTVVIYPRRRTSLYPVDHLPPVTFVVVRRCHLKLHQRRVAI
jgi:hypothetical protein